MQPAVEIVVEYMVGFKDTKGIVSVAPQWEDHVNASCFSLRVGHRGVVILTVHEELTGLGQSAGRMYLVSI
jgi:hypothetical protein